MLSWSSPPGDSPGRIPPPFLPSLQPSALNTRPRLISLLLLLSLTSLPALAQTEKPGEARSNMNAVDPEPWKEADTVLPAYPRPENLVKVESSYFDGNYEYFLDSKSLVAGGDGIARYSVVIRKPGSARQHVIHEGMLCANGAIRIYGMASGGVLKPQRSGWKPLSMSGPYVYRRALYESILCSEDGGPLAAEYVLARLRGDERAGVIGGSNSFYTERR